MVQHLPVARLHDPAAVRGVLPPSAVRPDSDVQNTRGALRAPILIACAILLGAHARIAAPSRAVNKSSSFGLFSSFLRVLLSKTKCVSYRRYAAAVNHRWPFHFFAPLPTCFSIYRSPCAILESQEKRILTNGTSV